MLENLSEQEKEDESGQAVEIALPGPGDHLIGTAEEKDEYAQRNGNVYVEDPVLQTLVGGDQVVPSGIGHRRYGHGHHDAPEKGFETIEPEFVHLKVLRERQHHHVAKGEAGHGHLVDQLSVDPGVDGVAAFQADVGFVTYGGDELCDHLKADLGPSESDPHFFFGKIDQGGLYARIEPLKVFQHPNAGAAVNAGDVEVDHGGVLVLEFNQAPGNVLVVQVIEFSGDVIRDRSGCRLQVVIAAQLVLIEYLVDRFATVATKGFAVKFNSIRTALGSAVIAIFFRHKALKNWVNF